MAAHRDQHLAFIGWTDLGVTLWFREPWRCSTVVLRAAGFECHPTYMPSEAGPKNAPHCPAYVLSPLSAALVAPLGFPQAVTSQVSSRLPPRCSLTHSLPGCPASYTLLDFILGPRNRKYGSRPSPGILVDPLRAVSLFLHGPRVLATKPGYRRLFFISLAVAGDQGCSLS